MPTYPRKHQLGNSLIYHVYNRSNGKIPIFKQDRDMRHFMNLLRDYSARFLLKIYHWVIMNNHYHLLLELDFPEQISRIMAGIGKAYSCYFHKEYLSSGFLWQGRFRLQPVQRERYLIACGRYIERNPVKAGIVTEACDYPYSSARFYCRGENDGITITDPKFLDFGANTQDRCTSYRHFLSIFDAEEERLFTDLEQAAGNTEFIRRLIKENGRLFAKRRGRLSKRFVA